jgi:hypothetical protein
MAKKSRGEAIQVPDVEAERSDDSGIGQGVVDYSLVDQVAKNLKKTKMVIGDSLEEGLKLEVDSFIAGQSFGKDFTELLRMQEWGRGIGFDKLELCVLQMIQAATDSAPRESFVQGLHSFFALCYYLKITNLVRLGEEEKKKKREGVEESKKGGRWADMC